MKKNIFSENKNITKKPILDFELGLKLANNQADLAHEILDCLAKILSDDIKKIETAMQQNNIAAAHSAIHRLRGAVCYCGTPRLLDELINLQKKIPTQQNNLAQIDLSDLKNVAAETKQEIEEKTLIPRIKRGTT